VFGGGGEAGKPGSHGWKPSDDDVSRAQHRQPPIVLRVLTVIPFMITGILGLIALVSWIAIVVFGVGTSRGTLWHWVAGRPAREVASQLALASLIGLACAAVAGLSVYAASYAVRERQPRYFWQVSQAVFSALALLLVIGGRVYPHVMSDIGLTGGSWWVAFAILAYAIIVIGVRIRRTGDDVDDGEQSGGGGSPREAGDPLLRGHRDDFPETKGHHGE
jgi:hypothetical protein